MTQQEAQERVVRGVALLDEKRPGWEHKISLTKLKLSSMCNCVVGQVCGDFDFWHQLVPSGHRPWMYGFDIQGFVDDASAFSVLQRHWRDAIQSRLSDAPLVAWTHREPARVS